MRANRRRNLSQKRYPQPKGNKALPEGGRMNTNAVNREDQELLEAFEAGEFESDLKSERRTQLAKLATEAIRKDKRINIRISSRDLEALQRRAMEEGLPYQSLVSSVLHKYVSGGFKDISANKASLKTNRQI
jgi:predicted DNA binding CopG/RHH family protein